MANSLLLIPTEREREWASNLLDALPPDIVVEQCGFGPIVAGIRTAQLISEYRPRRVWLVGIAGALNANLELGTAYEFNQVTCYGIGVGCGSAFRTASEMGWRQWSGSGSGNASQVISESLQLEDCRPMSSDVFRQLLTVCAASANAQDVVWHKEKFPLAMAEDMEGFAVAAACALAQVPLRIIRGLSNVAGDRNHRNWQSELAMRSAMAMFIAQAKDAG